MARNGTPVSNVQNVIALAGGIQRFIDQDDAVVLKPNGQWPNQGYTHTLCLKALIDVILNRPGGFAGEIIIAEHVHRDPATALDGELLLEHVAGQPPAQLAGHELLRAGQRLPQRGIPNVTRHPALRFRPGRLCRRHRAGGLAGGQAGLGAHQPIPPPPTAARCGCPHAILRSSYSGKLIDLKNGVWQNGGYTGQKVRLILLPTLNNHGSLNSEDYAGPTSAVKCHLGIVDFTGPGYSLHSVGYNTDERPGDGRNGGASGHPGPHIRPST